MKKKIVEYKVRRVHDVSALPEMVKVVNEDIVNGWQPYGRLIVKRGRWVQAMVKYATPVIILVIIIRSLL